MKLPNACNADCFKRRVFKNGEPVEMLYDSSISLLRQNLHMNCHNLLSEFAFRVATALRSFSFIAVNKSDVGCFSIRILLFVAFALVVDRLTKCPLITYICISVLEKFFANFLQPVYCKKFRGYGAWFCCDTWNSPRFQGTFTIDSDDFPVEQDCSDMPHVLLSNATNVLAWKEVGTSSVQSQTDNAVSVHTQTDKNASVRTDEDKCFHTETEKDVSVHTQTEKDVSVHTGTDEDVSVHTRTDGVALRQSGIDTNAWVLAHTGNGSLHTHGDCGATVVQHGCHFLSDKEETCSTPGNVRHQCKPNLAENLETDKPKPHITVSRSSSDKLVDAATRHYSSSRRRSIATTAGKAEGQKLSEKITRDTLENCLEKVFFEAEKGKTRQTGTSVEPGGVHDQGAAVTLPESKKKNSFSKGGDEDLLENLALTPRALTPRAMKYVAPVYMFGGTARDLSQSATKRNDGRLDKNKRRDKEDSGDGNKDKENQDNDAIRAIESNTPVMEQCMKEERARLASFHGLAVREMFLIRIAAAGFYRVEGTEMTRCAFCDVEVQVSKFEKEDPVTVHRHASPSCPLFGHEANNVTLEEHWLKVGGQYQEDLHRFYRLGQVEIRQEGKSLPPQPAGSGSGSIPVATNGDNGSVSAVTNIMPVSEGATPASARSFKNTASNASASVACVNNADPGSTAASTVSANASTPPRGSASSSAVVSAPAVNVAAPMPAFSAPSGAPPPPPPRQAVTYKQLGIYTEEPKRPDFAIATTRQNTYSGWPHCRTHTPEEMAEAGFYYVGQVDLVRCFYCKGGLKSWAPHLRPWVEHSRFYPKCPFVGQVKGQDFVDIVQELKMRQDMISEIEVEQELQRRLNERDGEVEAANATESEDLTETPDMLESENQSLTDARTCKICQTNEVSILFLPCGHLVSCAQCAPALRTCAICRQRVKGRVRVIADSR